MKKAQMMLLAVGTGLFLMSCGGAAEEKGAGSDDAIAEESNSESVSTTYTIDPAASTLTWKGSMMGMYDHSGTLAITSGTITVTDGDITGGNLEVDMTSITPTDDNYPEDKPKEKLVGHLSSADFFNVEEHPTATVEITSNSGTGMVDLTVRGITNSEEMSDLKFDEYEGNFDGKGVLTFDRTKYEVSFEHPMEDMVISNDVELTIILSGKAN